MDATFKGAGWLEVGGRLVEVPREGRLILGRGEDCDIQLEESTVSSEHASVEWRDGAVLVRDLGSKNGTVLDGRRLGRAGMRLAHGAVIRVGDCHLRFLESAEKTIARRDAEARRYVLTDELTVGRDASCDVVISRPNVSRLHARVTAGPPPAIVDLGSRNGTLVDGEAVGSAPLTDGAIALLGSAELRLEAGSLVVRDAGSMALRADRVAARAGGRAILQPTSLTLMQGEMMAVIGASGSGKTTLLKALGGQCRPALGSVRLGSAPVELQGAELGYVPQAETLHDELSVREALAFAARLRLPDDTTGDEIDARVDSVLAELDLQERAATRIGVLSGGQRKRVACGVELLGDPAFLLLDEPTSGLDPALERRFMELLRGLADRGRGVAVTTHATSSLALCDTVAVMAPGGSLAFLGAPEEALEHFGVGSYDEIYSRVSVADDAADGEFEAATEGAGHAAAERARSKEPPQRVLRRSVNRQLRMVTARYAKTLVRDRRTLLVLLGQVPVIALLIATVFPGQLLQRPDIEPDRSAQFLFLLVTAAIWLGLVSSTREIAKERSILAREASVGLRLAAYLSGKLLVLCLLALVQVGLLAGVALAIQPLDAEPAVYAAVVGMLALAAWSAIGLGLAVSSVARSVDQATSFVPLLLVPQLLFSGALIPYESMQAVAKVASSVVASRWAFAATGEAVDMNARLATSPLNEEAFGNTFFSLQPEVGAAVLAGLLVVSMVLTARLLRRRLRA